jgi:hypothetical protein
VWLRIAFRLHASSAPPPRVIGHRTEGTAASGMARIGQWPPAVMTVILFVIPPTPGT